MALVNGNNGDITSLNYNGKQLQDQSKFTHLSSGLGSPSDLVPVTDSIEHIPPRHFYRELEHRQRKHRRYYHQDEHYCKSPTIPSGSILL